MHLNRKNITISELSKITGTSRQNLTNKFTRNDFRENEMLKIAKAVNLKLTISLDNKSDG